MVPSMSRAWRGRLKDKSSNLEIGFGEALAGAGPVEGTDPAITPTAVTLSGSFAPQARAYGPPPDNPATAKRFEAEGVRHGSDVVGVAVDGTPRPWIRESDAGTVGAQHPYPPLLGWGIGEFVAEPTYRDAVEEEEGPASRIAVGGNGHAAAVGQVHHLLVGC